MFSSSTGCLNINSLVNTKHKSLWRLQVGSSVVVAAHGATVLFVSHCGMNGVMESLFHRVPLLCMPIFADQPDNAARLVERGLGLALDRYNVNHHLVTEAISEILQNKR